MKENKAISLEYEGDILPNEEATKKSRLKDWIIRHKRGLKLVGLAIASAAAGAIIHSKLTGGSDDEEEEETTDLKSLPDGWEGVDLGKDDVALFTTKDHLDDIQKDEEA